MKKNLFLRNNGLCVSNENMVVTTSHEMIGYQTKDPIVEEVRSIYEQLNTNITNGNIDSSTALFDDRSSYKLISDLEKLLSERFGYKIKIVSDESKNFGVMVVPPINYNTLNNSASETYTSLKEYLDITGQNNDVNPDKLKHGRDMIGVLNTFTKSFEAIESTLNLDTIKIDLNKAHIKGLPKEYVVVMMFDIHFMLVDLKLTVEELVAVTMHEVGHSFTHIEYAYRTYNQTSVIIDSIKDGVLNKNQSYRKTLVMAYESAFKEKMSSVESASTVSAIVKIANKYLDESRYLNSSMHSYTDSEQLADQFAGRFGLQKELFTALEKINNSIYFSSWYQYMNAYLPVIFIYGIIGILMGVGIVVVAEMVVGIACTTVLSIILANIIESLFTSGGTTKQMTYDERKRRLERVVNESIRNIRMTSLDNKEKSALINNTDYLIKMLDSVPVDNVSMVDKMFRLIMPNTDKHIDNKKFEQLVEDLQENRLHLSSAKFKELGK